MQNVALVINTDKQKALAAGQRIIGWLEDRGMRAMVAAEAATALNRPDLAPNSGTPWAEGAEVVLVLGGDGTLIRAAKFAAALRLPVLGINTGHLGFLTELENGEVFDHLEGLLTGHGAVEERMMLQVKLLREGRTIVDLTALNEAFVGKGPSSRLVHMSVSLAETTVVRYHADGIVVATPTGSTAYSLSAGGPIVAPNVEAILVTPVCPHTMNARPMIVSSGEQVCIALLDSAGEVGLSVDGEDFVPMHNGDVVAITRAAEPARLLRRYGNRFYEILRRKLGDADR